MLWEGAHLTYCLNIHPGETWDDNFSAIKEHASRVKQRVCPDAPFGLGIRLSRLSAETLLENTEPFREYLQETDMYVFTVNGFPYGDFHGTRVKEDVYRPDWSQAERLTYTSCIASALAELLPEDVDGSISTVPVAYGKNIDPDAVKNIVEAAKTLVGIQESKGRFISLALEPEPDCVLETTDEVVRFWNTLRKQADENVMKHIGICLDACHMACQFERPADSLERLEREGIPVPKIHLSAAPVIDSVDIDPADVFGSFAEETYLHQTRVMSAGEVFSFSDLPAALDQKPEGEWRVHFHVPLYLSTILDAPTTAGLLDDRFFAAAVRKGRHLEIETYSFNVLPGPKGDVVDSIVSEFEWVLNQKGKVR
jgi:hypothetical protein